MQSIDTSLIKIITTHYYIKRDTIVNKIEYKGKIFFDKAILVADLAQRIAVNLEIQLFAVLIRHAQGVADYLVNAVLQLSLSDLFLINGIDLKRPVGRNRKDAF